MRALRIVLLDAIWFFRIALLLAIPVVCVYVVYEILHMFTILAYFMPLAYRILHALSSNPPISQPPLLASRWPASGCTDIDRHTQSLTRVDLTSLNESIALQGDALSKLDWTLDKINDTAPKCKQLFSTLTARKNLFAQVRRSSRVAHEGFEHAVNTLHPIFINNYLDFNGLLPGGDERLHKRRLPRINDSLQQFTLVREDVAAAQKLVLRYNEQLISLSRTCLIESHSEAHSLLSRLWYFIVPWSPPLYLQQDIVTEFNNVITLNIAVFQVTLKILESRSCRFMQLLYSLEELSPSTAAILDGLQEEALRTSGR